MEIFFPTPVAKESCMKAHVIFDGMRRGVSCISFFFFLFSAPIVAEDGYHFYGRHFIAQYYMCDHDALINTQQLAVAMKQAVSASGARLLSTSDYVFDGNGYTMVLLLSESHASIHTYPEYDACFVDLFTCGQKCSAERFDASLRNYLKPKRVQGEVRDRK
jgi:S-adenosylmethionine decarboxylase